MEVEKECKLCDLLSGVNIYPSHNKHLKFKKNNNILFESCPHIVNKSFQEKINLLNKAKICPRCLCKYISSGGHSEWACKIPTKFKQLKCIVPACQNRYSTCQHHEDENKWSAKRKREDRALNQFNLINDQE